MHQRVPGLPIDADGDPVSVGVIDEARPRGADGAARSRSGRSSAGRRGKLRHGPSSRPRSARTSRRRSRPSSGGRRPPRSDRSGRSFPTASHRPPPKPALEVLGGNARAPGGRGQGGVQEDHPRPGPIGGDQVRAAIRIEIRDGHGHARRALAATVLLEERKKTSPAPSRVTNSCMPPPIRSSRPSSLRSAATRS